MQAVPENTLDILRQLADGAGYEELIIEGAASSYAHIFEAADWALASCRSDGGDAAYETLKEWRDETAANWHMPPFMVLTERSLRDIAGKKPATQSELAKCWGVGKAKLMQYGEAIVQALSSLNTSVAGISPLSASVLTFIATGHALWQIQDAYPDLNDRAVLGCLREVVQVLTEEIPRTDVSTETVAATGVNDQWQEMVDNIKARYPRAWFPWSEQEEEVLEAEIAIGKRVDEIADAHQRRPSAIRARLEKLGLA